MKQQHEQLISSSLEIKMRQARQLLEMLKISFFDSQMNQLSAIIHALWGPYEEHTRMTERSIEYQT
mgnify:FL=1